MDDITKENVGIELWKETCRLQGISEEEINAILQATKEDKNIERFWTGEFEVIKSDKTFSTFKKQ